MKSLLARLGRQGGEAFHRCGRPEVVHNPFSRPNRWRDPCPGQRVGAGRFARWRRVGMVGLLALGVMSACLAAGPPRLEPLANGKWPKFPREGFTRTKVVGGYAFTSPVFAVFDVRDPTNCVQVGRYIIPGLEGHDLALAAPYAYTTGPGGLAVIDVSDPLKCRRVGSWTNGVESGFRQVAVAGNYAYVGVEGGLKVLDVSNPARPIQVGAWTNATVSWPGVAVAGNYAYVTYPQGFQVIDVSNPTNCVLVGGRSGFSNSNVRRVVVAGTYACVKDDVGMTVFDVSNPTNCVQIGYYAASSTVDDIAVAGNYAFLTVYAWSSTNYVPSLKVIDVSKPAGPVQVGAWYAPTTRGGPCCVELVGSYAYVSDDRGSLRIIDVGNPANPVMVGGVSAIGSACQVAVAGNYAYVADSYHDLRVLDVSNPARPVEVGGWLNSAGLWSSGVAVGGNYAYVADMDQGLQVIDVSNPTNCVRVGAWTRPLISGYALGVAVAGKSVCLVMQFGTWDRELNVIDVTDPANPVPGGYYPFDDLEDVVTVGNYAYLAAAYDGLQVMDVSNPTNCVKVGGWVPGWTNFVDRAERVAVAGHYAYLAGVKQVTGNSNAATLQVIDISNLTNCVSVGGCYTTGEAVTAVATAGKYALVATPAGLQVIDVSNPTNCVRVGAYAGALGVTVAGNRIYLAEWGAGVEVLRSLPGVQFTFRVDGTAGQALTVEAATNLAGLVQWTPVLTTNAASMPFDFVDYEVTSPQKFYRVRQQP